MLTVGDSACYPGMVAIERKQLVITGRRLPNVTNNESCVSQ